MDPKDMLARVKEQGEKLVAQVRSMGVAAVEVYGRFGFQWLERVQFQCEDLAAKDIPKLEGEDAYFQLKLLASTTLLGVAREKKDPAKEPFLKWLAAEARTRKLFDSFEGKTVRMPFEWVCGLTFECLSDVLGMKAIRDFDVRILAQMSIPKLWKKATPDCFISESPNLEGLRLMNLSEVATDLNQICEFIPEVAVREIVMYIEEHMTKTKLKQKFVDKIKANCDEVIKKAQQWNSPTSDTKTTPSGSTS